MSDVFISYSSADRALAERMADELQTRGFSVWWDTRLLPSDEFRTEIDDALKRAKAVVIIWTPNSIKSRWVHAEADDAERQHKLINLHTGDIEPRMIPKPFNQYNSAGIANFSHLLSALNKLGAHPVDNEPDTLGAVTGEPSITFHLERTVGMVLVLCSLVMFVFAAAMLYLALDVLNPFWPGPETINNREVRMIILTFPYQLLKHLLFAIPYQYRTILAGITALISMSAAVAIALPSILTVFGRRLPVARLNAREMTLFGRPLIIALTRTIRPVQIGWDEVKKLNDNLYAVGARRVRLGEFGFRKAEFASAVAAYTSKIDGADDSARVTPRPRRRRWPTLPSEAAYWTIMNVAAALINAALALAIKGLATLLVATDIARLPATMLILGVASGLATGWLRGIVLRGRIAGLSLPLWCIVSAIFGIVEAMIEGLSGQNSGLMSELDEMVKSGALQLDASTLSKVRFAYGGLFITFMALIGAAYGLLRGCFEGVILGRAGRGVYVWIVCSSLGFGSWFALSWTWSILYPLADGLAGQIEVEMRSAACRCLVALIMLPALAQLRPKWARA